MRGSVFFAAACCVIQTASAGTVSYTGTLASFDDASTQITVNLASAGNLDLQTWGFGGGTNAAGAVIPAGGFDPFIGVFAGTGSGATFIDGTSDTLSNFGSFQGCPPAGTVDIGGSVCGDITLSFSLAAGTYTVLLTDGNYTPAAVFGIGGTLGDGFFDFTGGALQTCNGDTCITPTANWALDVTTPDSTASTPEPGGAGICGLGLAMLALVFRTNKFTTWRMK
jgi:hypothetical protein